MPKTTKPIPEGMTSITPHIVCDGAAEAIKFYKEAFGAVEMGTMLVPGSDKILHAMVRIGDSMLMLVDEFPEWGKLSPLSLNGSPVTIHLYVKDVDELVDRAVSAGAKVTMPLEDTFWGDRYCTLEDPFGHKWSVATHIRDVTPEEMERAAREMFGS